MDLKQKIEFQEEVEAFLDQYSVYDLFDYLLKELLIDRPEEPLDYLIQKLHHKRRRRLFLIGGVGSKRRHITREISSRFQIEKVFLLDLLKAEVRKAGKHEAEIQECWNSGSYIPDHIVLEIVLPVIEELEKKGASYLIEGVPRTRVQCLALQRAGVIPDRVVYLNLADSDFKQGFVERYSELATHKSENQGSVQERALQEFNYHLAGIRAAYGAHLHEINFSGEISAMSGAVYKVYLAKGRSKAPRKPPRVIVLGPPGAGKTTLARNLAETYGLIFVSVQNLVRDNINRKTETGKEVNAMLSTSQQVAGFMMTQLVRDRIMEPECRINGWVLDGYPITLDHAKSLKECKIIPTHVVFLECPDALVYERIEQRRLDPVTGKFYNVMGLPDDEEIRNRVIQLTEDTHEAIKKRLTTYKDNAMKIHAEYSGFIVNIKADVPPAAACDIAKEAIEASIPHDLD